MQAVRAVPNAAAGRQGGPHVQLLPLDVRGLVGAQQAHTQRHERRQRVPRRQLAAQLRQGQVAARVRGRQAHGVRLVTRQLQRGRHRARHRAGLAQAACGAESRGACQGAQYSRSWKFSTVSSMRCKISNPAHAAEAQQAQVTHGTSSASNDGMADCKADPRQLMMLHADVTSDTHCASKAGLHRGAACSATAASVNALPSRAHFDGTLTFSAASSTSCTSSAEQCRMYHPRQLATAARSAASSPAPA